MQPRQATEHSAQRKPNRLVQMRIYCKAACRKARCRRCHAERIARLKRMRQKRDERNCRRPERPVQPREMPGNKADGAVMVLQTRRTRHRRQSNDWRVWRGQSECGASIAAKRRPAFSADSQAQHTTYPHSTIRQSDSPPTYDANLMEIMLVSIFINSGHVKERNKPNET